MGDVYRLTQSGVDIILLIDGYFDHVPAVSHKELLFALSQGVIVYGCSSMGALRAAELHPYGMVGIGEVFQQYLRGECEDDDEVVVTHGPVQLGYKRTSDAMIDIRYGLRLAERAYLISPSTRLLIEATAKRLYFPERHWGTLLRWAAQSKLPAGELASLSDFVKRWNPSLKARDAIKALCMLANTPDQARRSIAFKFESTNSWQRLQRQESEPPK